MAPKTYVCIQWICNKHHPFIKVKGWFIMWLISWVFRQNTTKVYKDYLFLTHGGKTNPHSHLLGSSQRKLVEIGLTYLDLPSLEPDHTPFITLSWKGVLGGKRWSQGNGTEPIWCQSWEMVENGKNTRSFGILDGLGAKHRLEAPASMP